MTQHNNDQAPSSVSPAKGHAAVYARQAARARGTTSPQTAALIEVATEQGYSPERITVYEEGGVSGRRALVQRGALSDLLAAIAREDQDPIRAVFVLSEERLFGGPAVGDIASFIEACSKRGVTLITPTSEYDFTDPAQVALFRLRCEQAAAFREQQARQFSARMRLARRSSRRAGE